MTKQTLCWNCANACGGCSWSNHWEHRPVPGWVAAQTRMKGSDGTETGSYVVYECPAFEADKPRKKPDESGEPAKKPKKCQKRG